MISELEVVLRLLAAGILGGLVGLEREVNNRPAGLRTHILVTSGAALIMLVSKYGFLDLGISTDPARLAAQVISGIGFLGAGTIIMHGNMVHGLTTAASLWTSAGIGLAIGAGYYVGAIACSFIMMFTLVILRAVENSIFVRRYNVLHVIAKERVGLIGEIGSVFAKHSLIIKHINMRQKENNDEVFINIEFVLKMTKRTECNRVIEEINEIKDVQSSYWEES